MCNYTVIELVYKVKTKHSKFTKKINKIKTKKMNNLNFPLLKLKMQMEIQDILIYSNIYNKRKATQPTFL